MEQQKNLAIADPPTGEGGPSGNPAQPAYQQQLPPREWPRGAFDPRAKSPALACFLSLMPGLGQIYVGYYQRGFIHGITFAGLIALLVAQADREFTPLIPMTAIFLGFFFLYNIIDAGRRASLYNQALQGTGTVSLPEESGLLGGGSTLAGVILIGGGLILLMHTRFDWSLDWLEEWWPVAPILFGAYLVYRNIESNRRQG